MNFYDFNRNLDYYLFMVNDLPGNYGPAFYPITKGRVAKINEKDDSFLFVAENGQERWFTYTEQQFIQAYQEESEASQEYKIALKKAKDSLSKIIYDDDFDCDENDEQAAKWCDNIMKHHTDLEMELYKRFKL